MPPKAEPITLSTTNWTPYLRNLKLMKKSLLVYSLLISASLNVQMSRDDNLADFDYGVEMIETVYSGFDFKVIYQM